MLNTENLTNIQSAPFDDDRLVQVVCGPLLRYIEIDYQQRIWRGSCLIVINSRKPPSLTLLLQSNESFIKKSLGPAKAEAIDVFREEYYFWRYELLLPMLNESQTVTYTSDCFSGQFQFHVPAIQNSMRFMFYSCNGFSDTSDATKAKYGEREAPLWQDVLDKHHQSPIHVILGGGDQLYQDKLIEDDFMKPWVAERDPARRLIMQLPQAMKDGFESFYFWNYIKNFGFKQSPVQAQVFATIPSVNMWDDHDIIDGFGSYPADMQSADCFQVLFANASRFYYLFQQHTNLDRTERDGMIRGKLADCNHILTTLGPDIGFLSLDARGERTKHQVCSKESYDRVFQEMYQRLPITVKHFLVLTGVPLIYPRLTLFEKAMNIAASFKLATLVGRTGALGDIIASQLNEWNGDPELLDDMNDHWTARNHEEERRAFIKKLQAYAKEKSIRVSFLGGDVHCCGAGKLYSTYLEDKEEIDPYFMVQIVSSAIVNVPPPTVLLTVLNQNSCYYKFDGNVEEKMYDLFRSSPNGKSRQNKKLMGMRNYCVGYFDENTEKLNYWIQAEISPGIKGTKGYLVDVPRLLFGEAGQHLHSKNHKKYLMELIPITNSLISPTNIQQEQQTRQEEGQKKSFLQALVRYICSWKIFCFTKLL